MLLLCVVYIVQIAVGRMTEGVHAGMSVLPALVMLVATMVPFAHAIFLALFFGMSYEALAVAPFGLSVAGMLAGVVITTDIIYHMKEQALSGRLVSALAGVVVYACIVYGGAFYVVRSMALVRIGMWEVGIQMIALIGMSIAWGLIQYMRTGKVWA